MPGQAKITSVEAIDAFRAALILFVSQARPALEEVSSEVMRTRLWMENDQRRFWQTELRNRQKKLEQAQSELLSAKFSNFQDSTALQQMAVRRARLAIEQAEHKLKALKRWDRELENSAAPLLKEIEMLQGLLTGEMPKAIAYLAQVVRALDAYADVLAGPGNAAAAPEGKKP